MKTTYSWCGLTGRKSLFKTNLTGVPSLTSSLAFIFPRSFLLRTAPHYLNAWNRLQLLMTKSGRILCLMRKWRQKCSLLQVNAPLTEKTWDEVELFSFWKLKWRTLHSFQDWELQLELGEIMAFERIIKQNNYWIRLSYHINNYGDLGGCYPPRRTVSTVNILLDLDNSS